jgi:hypothetical protein
MKVGRAADLPRVPFRWSPAFRIIPSRFPPINLFEKVADPADLEAVFLVESLTNDRLRDEVGELSLVAPQERVSGPGSSFVMAAFTHIRPGGGRFSDGSFGAFYCARDRDTAIAETVYHRERFLREMAAPPTQLDMRVLRCLLKAELHDLRGCRSASGCHRPPSPSRAEAWPNFGIAMAARMPMMTTTIISSIRVKPLLLRRFRMCLSPRRGGGDSG